MDRVFWDKFSENSVYSNWYTGSWGILAWGERQFGEVLGGGGASWGTLTCRISWVQFLFLFIHIY